MQTSFKKYYTILKLRDCGPQQSSGILVATFWHFLAALSLLFVGTLGGACSPLQLPNETLAERLAYNEFIKSRYQVDPEWWKIFQDSQLNSLVARALENNIDLAKASLNVTRALYQLRKTQGGLIPSFSGGGGVSTSRRIDAGDNFRPSFSTDLRLNYELDIWGKTWNSVSSAEFEYYATTEDLESLKATLINGVVDSYYHLAYLNDALAAQEITLKNYQALAQNIQIKYEAGKVPAVEPAQAAQQVINTENTILDLTNQKRDVLLALRDFLNLLPTAPLGIQEPSLAGFIMPEVNLNIPLAVLANRPDLRAQEFRVFKAFKNIKVAERAWLPSITLGAALGSSGSNLGNIFNTATASGSVSLNLPFLQWNEVLWNLKISEVDFESARLDFEKALTTALNEVDVYLHSYQNAQKALENTSRKFTYDLRISDYYRDRYESGAAELSDWLNALNTVNSARLSTLNSRYQVIQYLNMVYKAMSGRYLENI
ncbi:MAG: TolC family protein [Deltaproteobacteria bacterium]|jgi:NodT family efflux transporter outer membrane factor (OMF) lipoprotein|nr:TolC family protein [Deltaproteobacteria bacterium]